MGRNPRETADQLGIVLQSAHEAPFRVGCRGDVVVYAWHPDQRVRDARMWEGIAQVILTRAGVSWSERAALCLAARLKIGAPALH
jgi:hypothetical protein